ncbi:MAG: type II secretion system protein GspD [Bilophila wadsworthia]
MGNTSYNIQSILNAVRGNSDVDVLATPQLLTLDNEEASVEVVDNIPFTKESTTRNDNDFTTQSMDYKDVGVKLKITPRISDDGSLRLEVEQEVSRVTQGLITLTNGDQLVAPTTRKRLVKTTILLQDSQDGGHRRPVDDQKTYNQSEVPGPAGIPVLGWLFKSATKSTQTNLFIFITPKVIRNAADSADLAHENSSYCMKRGGP